eukprot:TRINITY_DN3750_c0_g1_i1.p1 TRINITY_DN3750_c0_g1~~TRINITY_DN3750_c0_g1_i1.p1  ORF type:complete len:244 (-),score=46.98 TRINITY_DN3750_c0_g1_i1:367-1098(-)
MMVGCKRPISTEDLLDPFVKRSRLYDVCMIGCEEPTCWCPANDATAVSAARDADVVATAAAAVAEAERRRLLPACDAQEDEPALKRLRGMLEEKNPCASAVPDSTANNEGSACIQQWSEGLVRALHGSPSVEQAVERSAAVLSEFEAEVRQKALSQVEHAAASSEDTSCAQNLQPANKVLLRAVYHLAERCRRLEGASREDEIHSLRQALDQSQDMQRRLQHSNEVLQEHIRIHLNSCRNGVL